MTLQVFVSHRAEDSGLAENLRYNIENLSDSGTQVHVCHKIQGGQEWRDCW
jgi:hypothetical protein